MSEEPLKQLIKQSMDSLTQAIDTNTQVKLNEARHAAIKKSKHNYTVPWSWLLGAGTAVVMFLAVFLMQTQDAIPTHKEFVIFEDLDILTNEADTDFYQDLEFLTWLDANNIMDTES